MNCVCESNINISPEFIFSVLVLFGDRLEPNVQVFETFLAGLEDRLELCNPDRRLLVYTVDFLFSMSDQRLFELCRDIRSHLRDIFFPVLLPFSLYPALVRKWY